MRSCKNSRIAKQKHFWKDLLVRHYGPIVVGHRRVFVCGRLATRGVDEMIRIVVRSLALMSSDRVSRTSRETVIPLVWLVPRPAPSAWVTTVVVRRLATMAKTRAV